MKLAELNEAFGFLSFKAMERLVDELKPVFPQYKPRVGVHMDRGYDFPVLQVTVPRTVPPQDLIDFIDQLDWVVPGGVGPVSRRKNGYSIKWYMNKA